jgi:hypothetical protein
VINDFGLKMQTMWQSCHSTTITLGKKIQNLGPIFLMGMSLALFLCCLLVIFHQKKNG